MDKIKIPYYAKLKASEALRYNSKVPSYKKVGINKTEARKLGINSGIERAKQIKRSKYLPLKDAKRVAAFYNRFKGSDTPRAEQAINLWGGRKFGRKVNSLLNRG